LPRGGALTLRELLNDRHTSEWGKQSKLGVSLDDEIEEVQTEIVGILANDSIHNEIRYVRYKKVSNVTS
jgi:hypothetical protein